MGVPVPSERASPSSDVSQSRESAAEPARQRSAGNQTANNHPASNQTANNHPAGEGVSEGTTKNTIPKNTAPKNTAPKDTAPKDTAPKDWAANSNVFADGDALEQAFEQAIEQDDRAIGDVLDTQERIREKRLLGSEPREVRDRLAAINAIHDDRTRLIALNELAWSLATDSNTFEQ